jgi:release factor glutamine methyltransferase
VNDSPTASAPRWGELLVETTRALRVGAVDDAAQEARWIVEEASGRTAGELLGVSDERATTLGVAAARAMVERRLAGEPIQYVLGHWPFRSIDLMVDRRVLIPRPETEFVVDVVHTELDRLDAGGHGHLTIVDLGTGSGAIALSVATERRTVEVWATDRSSDALSVARANLAGTGRAGTRVRLVEGDWYAALPGDLAGRFDLVVSNPPYVAAHEALPASVADWEPRDALVAGPAGSEAVASILADARHWLAPGGVVVLEIGPTIADSAEMHARSAGFARVELLSDQYQQTRALVARS